MKNIREDLKKIDSERQRLRSKELELNKVMLGYEDIGEGYRKVKRENKQLEEEFSIVERLIEKDRQKSVLSEVNKKALLSMKEIKL